ncbi:MAG: hypothetical protein RL148_1259 [Planctomycetota bacterium]|jgi:hypothetical protein
MIEHLQRQFLSRCRDPLAARALLRRIMRSSLKDSLEWAGLELVPDPEADGRVGQAHLAAAFHVPGPHGCALVKIVHVTSATARNVEAMFDEYLRLLPALYTWLDQTGRSDHHCTYHLLLETSPDELDGDDASVAPRKSTLGCIRRD